MRRACIAVLLMVLGACSAAPQHQDDASKMVDTLYGALQQQHWDAAMDMYGKQFYAGHSREAWLKKLQSVQQKLGAMEGRTLISKSKDPRFHYDVYVFSYRVKYAKGESTDVITLFQNVTGGELTVVGHKITLRDGA